MVKSFIAELISPDKRTGEWTGVKKRRKALRKKGIRTKTYTILSGNKIMQLVRHLGS
jgi:hypothetical protein